MILNILIARALFCGFTLYMMMILARWLGPYLELDFYDTRLRWIARAVDPALRFVRKTIPPIGPFDVAPVATLLAVWILRQISLLILPSSMP